MCEDAVTDSKTRLPHCFFETLSAAVQLDTKHVLTLLSGPQELPTLWSQIPTKAIGSYTSNMPQHDIGCSCQLVCTSRRPV